VNFKISTVSFLSFVKSGDSLSGALFEKRVEKAGFLIKYF